RPVASAALAGGRAKPRSLQRGFVYRRARLTSNWHEMGRHVPGSSDVAFAGIGSHDPLFVIVSGHTDDADSLLQESQPGRAVCLAGLVAGRSNDGHTGIGGSFRSLADRTASIA